MLHRVKFIIFIVTVLLSTSYGQDEWQLRIIGEASTPGQAQAVASYYNYALVADLEGGLVVFDLFDPTFPESVGSYSHGGIVNDLVVNGHRAFLAHWARGVTVLDISNPAQPESIAAYNTPGTAIDLAISNGLLYVADLFNGLVILDVSDLPEIARRGVIPIDSSIGAVAAVAVADSAIYLSAQGVGLLTYSLADTLNPERRDIDYLSTDCNDIVVYGDYLFLACGQAGMLIYDITDKLHPDSIARVNTPGSTNRIAVKDTIAFLADGANGIVAVNVTNPRSPAVIQTLDTPGNANGVALCSDFILVADRFQFLVVYHQAYVDIAEYDGTLPTDFKIDKCYPNPFNSSVRINFELRQDAAIALSIYDVCGRLIAKLCDGFYDAGCYSISWDGANCPSGMYFVKLTDKDNLAGGSSTAKILYLK